MAQEPSVSVPWPQRAPGHTWSQEVDIHALSHGRDREPQGQMLPGGAGWDSPGLRSCSREPVSSVVPTRLPGKGGSYPTVSGLSRRVSVRVHPMRLQTSSLGAGVSGRAPRQAAHVLGRKTDNRQVGVGHAKVSWGCGRPPFPGAPFPDPTWMPETGVELTHV